MHIKRKTIQNFWPVRRKGTKYLAVSTHNKKNSIPLIVVMRDILHLVKTKKELKKVLSEKKIFINHKEIRDTHYPVGIFDVISIPLMKKHFRVLLNKSKRFAFEEIAERDSEKKVFKIIGKTTLKGNLLQINLLEGRNLVIKEVAHTDDSILFNLKKNQVEKIIKMEPGKKAFVTQGKHMGKNGKIENIVERGGKKLAKITTDDHKNINVWIKNIMVSE